MSQVREHKHYVIFQSPGTLFAESSEREIASWDTKKAMRLVQKVVERHGATPYGFYFETRIVAKPISDGEGGTLQVQSKTVKTSDIYFINGVVETLAEVEARADAGDDILLSNIRCNKWEHIVTTRNGYRWTAPFILDKDHVVNEKGEITI